MCVCYADFVVLLTRRPPGDANPTNVSLLVRGAEMRVAETRAVNRALRKAYGIGLCPVEELGARYLTRKAFIDLLRRCIFSSNCIARPAGSCPSKQHVMGWLGPPQSH